MSRMFFIVAMIALFSVVVRAEQTCQTRVNENSVEEKLEIKTDVPKHLEGATIIVRLKDGTESAVPAEKFKVVPRKQQFITTKVVSSHHTVCSSEKEKNRVSLLAGDGPQNDLNVKKTPTKVTVESSLGAVGGVQYQRLITDDISIGGQLQTNDSVLVNIGIDF